LGWIPQSAKLTPRPATLPSWDSIPEEEKSFQRRLMEVFAGFTEHVDAQIGRIVDEIDRLGYGENTLIFYIWGDNGASAEGQNGTISELLAQNGIPTTTKDQIEGLDSLGGLDALGSPKTDNMYHAGWAWAGSTPYQATKLIASHFGGTRNPLAIRWPALVKPDATQRSQFLHVIDVAPTIYDVVGINPPRVVNGVPQDPFDGVSFAATFNDANAKEVRHTQYSLGGFSGGLALYVKDGVLSYEYNLFEIQRTHIKAKDKLPTGKVKIEVETTYVERKPAGSLKVMLKVNGKEVASGEVPVSAPLTFTANDALDLGVDLGSPVGIEYYDQAPFKFNGGILGAQVKYVGADAKLNGEEEREVEGPIPVAD
jgi:hypothetical protein